MIVALALQLTLAASFPSTPTYRLAESDPPPVIDGQLDDEVWQHAEVIGDFHQVRPTDGGPPSQRTEVRIVHDAHHIYVAIAAFDTDPDEIIARHLVQGRTFLSDDRVEIHLDTFNDRRNAYFFQVSVNGMRRDALIGNDNFIDDWNPVWDAAATRQPWGWSAEMKIPTRSISFDPATDTWGFNVTREITRNNEEVAWASRERRTSPAVSGYLTGIEGLEQGIGVELVPSLTLQDDSPHVSPSLTAFYQPTPFITAALTLNTDFSDTEADDRQVNLTRFSLFTPEKRDFFLQDANIFEFGGLSQNARPFFSRRIGLSADGGLLDLDAGVKLTGRAGDWNFGTLAVRQEPGVAGGSSDVFVGRVSRNILSESSVGAIVTYGDPLSANGNRLYGVDVRLSDSDFGDGKRLLLDAWAQRTDTEGLGGDQDAYGARLAYPNDRIDWSVNYQFIGEGFRPALGFANRTGIRQLEGGWQYRHRFDSGGIDSLGSRVNYFRAEHLDGNGLQSEIILLDPVVVATRSGAQMVVFGDLVRENLLEPFEISDGIVIPDGEYAFDRYGVFARTGDQHALTGSIDITNGGFFDGDRLASTVNLDWRPNAHVRLGGGYVFNDVDLPQGDFISRLYQVRADIAFNARWAWLNLVQADNTSETLGFNSRLRWQPDPRLDMFLVVNQLSERRRFDPFETRVAFKVRYRWQL